MYRTNLIQNQVPKKVTNLQTEYREIIQVIMNTNSLSEVLDRINKLPGHLQHQAVMCYNYINTSGSYTTNRI